MRTTLLLTTVLLACSALYAGPTCQSLLDEHKAIMGSDTYDFLKRQHDTYAAGQAPKIAAPEIKAIPIQECGEPLVNIAAGLHPRIGAMEGDLLQKAFYKPEDIDPRAPTY